MPHLRTGASFVWVSSAGTGVWEGGLPGPRTWVQRHLPEIDVFLIVVESRIFQPGDWVISMEGSV